MSTLFILIQFIVPQHLLSRIVGKLASTKIKWLKNRLINAFIKAYGINMNEAEHPFAEEYENFNTFFTRALKPGSREICQSPSIACPADGAISEIGGLNRDQILQAKSKFYTASSLLASASDAALFENGLFATIYLSPKDYHRVHMPLSGRLVKTRYVPGALFSVNQTTANHVDNVFARNERLVCLFETEQGPMAVILVGAMIVAGISTVWQKQYVTKPFTVVEELFEGADAPTFQQGDELGRFYLGSTAIVLLPNNSAEWMPELSAETTVSMGQAMGSLII